MTFQYYFMKKTFAVATVFDFP